MFNTAQFHGDFMRLSTNGACNPINLLPSYWQGRVAAEIASLVLNVVALLVSAFLSWRLAKVMQSRSCFTGSQHSSLFRLFSGLWLADFQACRGFKDYQPCLQTCARALGRYSAVALLHGDRHLSLARSTLQWLHWTSYPFPIQTVPHRNPHRERNFTCSQNYSLTTCLCSSCFRG